MGLRSASPGRPRRFGGWGWRGALGFDSAAEIGSATVKAIQLTEFSGADAMEYVDVDDPVAGDGQVVVDVARCGVNFADTHAPATTISRSKSCR